MIHGVSVITLLPKAQEMERGVGEESHQNLDTVSNEVLGVLMPWIPELFSIYINDRTGKI